MRGYQPSETPEGATYYGADLAHDVVALVRSLGASRATLLGHDWGAHATYSAALLAPEMFDRIVPRAKDGNDQKVPLLNLTGYDAWESRSNSVSSPEVRAGYSRITIVQ